MRKKIIALMANLMISMLISGCASTISTIFYPKERAGKAADSVIDDILNTPTPAPTPATPKAETPKK